MGAMCVKTDSTLNVDHQYQNVPSSERLHVLTAFYMPLHSKVRIDLYRQFQKHMAQFPHVEMWTIECALAGNGYYVTKPTNSHHVQVSCAEPLWFKENLLNILLKRMPKHVKYYAWIDADVYFTNKNWPVEAIQRLQKADVVQLFENSEFIGSQGQVQYKAKSLMYYAKTNLAQVQQLGRHEETYPHPGYAWAMSASYLGQIKKLFEYNIVGSGDKMMAYAALGMWELGLQAGYKLHESFVSECRKWSEQAVPFRGYDYIPGKLVHNYHGERSDRNYVNRWELLERFGFDPIRDIFYNENGVIQLADTQRDLQREVRQYFVDRKQHLVKPFEVKKKDPPKKPAASGTQNTKPTNSSSSPHHPYQPSIPHPHPHPIPDPHHHHHHHHRHRSRSRSGDRHRKRSRSRSREDHHHNHHERDHHHGGNDSHDHNGNQGDHHDSSNHGGGHGWY